MFIDTDANLVEINPLILTKDKKIVCLDAKMNFDDNALFRNPDILNLRDFNEEEETETKLYKVPILNATFTLMSLTLLLLTVWAVWQDYDREWKRYNYEWQDFQAQQLDAEITARKKAIQDELAKLLAEIDQTEKRLDNPSMRLHRTRVNQAKSDAKIADTEAKFWKSDLDANKFVHEKKIEKIIHDHGRETPEAAKKIEALEKSFHAERIEPYEKLQAAAQIATTMANEE